MSDNNGSIVPCVVAAFAVGALVGGGLALLYAPRSGKETRAMVGKKAHDLKDAAEDAIESGKQMASDVGDRAREVYDKTKQAAREIAASATRSA